MDMEHQLHQLLHFSPQEHFMPSPGFFSVDDSGQDAAHFPDGGLFVVEQQVGATTGGIDDDSGGWVEDLMQLGEELFGGRDHGGSEDVDVIGGAGMGDDLQPWQCDGGGSPDGPPPSISLDGDSSPPSGSGDQGAGELASEPHREDGDDVSAAGTRKRDRSKTIVSERKRRVRMKEKLYELRSLVPNITKVRRSSTSARTL